MLGLGSQGLRDMYGKKPIQKVSDLKGVKMNAIMFTKIKEAK